MSGKPMDASQAHLCRLHWPGLYRLCWGPSVRESWPVTFYCHPFGIWVGLSITFVYPDWELVRGAGLLLRQPYSARPPVLPRDPTLGHLPPACWGFCSALMPVSRSPAARWLTYPSAAHDQLIMCVPSRWQSTSWLAKSPSELTALFAQPFLDKSSLFRLSPDAHSVMFPHQLWDSADYCLGLGL